MRAAARNPGRRAARLDWPDGWQWRGSCIEEVDFTGARRSMEIFLQQLINGLTLGAIYGLIAIGYTMVYGIIGMINFAHGDVYMIGAFIALIVFLLLAQVVGMPRCRSPSSGPGRRHGAPRSMDWTVERIAYRPLRGSFRLAPLISAIGMSILLQNYVQLLQGAAQQADAADLHGGIIDAAAAAITSSCSTPDRHRRADSRADGRLLVTRAGRRSAAPSAPASRTGRWPRCSASTSTAPSRSPSSWAPGWPRSPA